MKPNLWIVIGSISAFLSIALGAFGAHALAGKLSPHAQDIYRTGAQYQLYHAIGMILLGIWASFLLNGPNKSVAPPLDPLNVNLTGGAFLVGTLLFSGSLYALALTDIKILGAITPFGGLLFMLGWVSLAWSAWRA